MEEWRQEANEAVKKIEEEKSMCSKVVEQVSQTWEELINNSKLGSHKGVVHNWDRRNSTKEWMKKLPLAEKMAKAAEMRKLQQEFAVLRIQQQHRNDRVGELQTEVERITSIIQLVH